MAWTAPMTAVANTVFTAAQFNTHVRDNFLETAPAKATTVSGFFVATGTNAIAQRMANRAAINTAGTTTSSSYTTSLTSGGTNPSLTITTGERVFIAIEADMAASGTSGFIHLGYGVSGATTLAAGDERSAYVELTTSNSTKRIRLGVGHILTSLTPGSNTFELNYKISGSAGTGTFQRRTISVIPF